MSKEKDTKSKENPAKDISIRETINPWKDSEIVHNCKGLPYV